VSFSSLMTYYWDSSFCT